MPAVVFLMLDAVAPRRLDPVLTPTLRRWATAPGAVAATGRAVMASCTYPNHATFVTGVGPEAHGITSNWLVTEGGPVGSWERGPQAPTLFDECRRRGLSAEAVLGDHHLVGVMGARAAEAHWPPDGELTGDVPLDGLGYPADEAVLPRLLEALGHRPDLTVGYFGSVDTISHLFGPDSEEATGAYRALDRRLAEVDRTLAACWDDTVLVVVSDHDQETALDLPGIDLRGEAHRKGVEVQVVDEGSAAVVRGPADARWLEGIDGVAGWRATAGGRHVVWGEPGRFFGVADAPLLRGIHGGIHTRDQLALVGGGHPRAAEAARRVRDGIAATAWAPLVSSLLGS
jgi:arylsulfatase A-like enzyme